MKLAGHVAHTWDRREMHAGFRLGNPKERDRLKDVRINGRHIKMEIGCQVCGVVSSDSI